MMKNANGSKPGRRLKRSHGPNSVPGGGAREPENDSVPTIRSSGQTSVLRERMTSLFDNILVLAPHPDDAELGCGGLIARLADEGRKVTIGVLTDRDGNLPYVNDSSLQTESQRAARILSGRKKDTFSIKVLHFTFPIREFSAARQRIFTSLERLRNELRPNLILAPARGDLHQDHAVAFAEAQRVFRGFTQVTYEVLRSNFTFIPNLFMEISAKQLARKTQAVQCYQTQSHKPYCSAEVIVSQATVMGAKADCKFAEGFFVETMVV